VGALDLARAGGPDGMGGNFGSLENGLQKALIQDLAGQERDRRH